MKGLLAYSNWDDNVENHPHIGLSGLDGEDLVILVNDSLRWPNGLAFDMPSNRLFWGEAYYDLLESIRLDGTGRVSVKPAINLLSLHPFSVGVFENTIYCCFFTKYHNFLYCFSSATFLFILFKI